MSSKQINKTGLLAMTSHRVTQSPLKLSNRNLSRDNLSAGASGLGLDQRGGWKTIYRRGYMTESQGDSLRSEFSCCFTTGDRK